MPTQHHYDQVAHELRESEPLPGLWARAFSECDGDMNRARALYIRYRAEELANAEAQIARVEKEEQQRRANADRALRTKRVGVSAGLYGLMLLGFAFMLVAVGGLYGAFAEKQWEALFTTAIFGTLGFFSIRKARDGLAALK